VTPFRSDLVGTIKPPAPGATIKGIQGKKSGNVKIAGLSTVAHTIRAVNGMLRTIKLPALWVPNAGAGARIISIQSFLQHHPKEHAVITSTGLDIKGDPDIPGIHVPLDPRNNLPMLQAYTHDAPMKAATCLNTTISQVHDSNLNLSEAQKELLRWHQRLGHVSFSKVQFLMRTVGTQRRQASPSPSCFVSSRSP